MRAWYTVAGWTFLSVGLLCVGGCGDTFANLTASLGGDVAGRRGSIRVLFINNTPHRVVFTFGSYDPLDQFSQPDFDQFGLDDVGRVLDGESESDILSIFCARVFSIGGPQLLELIERNRPDAAIEEDAFIDRVEFFNIDPDDPAQDRPQTVGSAPSFEALLGADFPCNALLIIRFEFDDLGPDPFRVDFELIPSESSR